MGRKPKNKVEGDTPLPPITAPEYPDDSIAQQENTIYINTTEEIIGISNNTTSAETEYHSPLYPSIQDTVDKEMFWALKEIERCDDYIYASADLDRRFSVYRSELYTYRYNIRQLSLRDNYPNISESLMPTRPDYVADV